MHYCDSHFVLSLKGTVHFFFDSYDLFACFFENLTVTGTVPVCGESFKWTAHFAST
jgi:hypothetical protein